MHISNIINNFISEKINYNNLIMEDFVPFEIAKKLKEKGFREECFARYYCSDKAYFEENSYNPDTESIFYCYNNDEDLGRFYIDAPTISQTLKWLREKEISVEPISTLYNCWDCYIKNKGELETIINNDKYKTYEKAALAGIECVLDNSIDYGKNRFN